MGAGRRGRFGVWFVRLLFGVSGGVGIVSVLAVLFVLRWVSATVEVLVLCSIGLWFLRLGGLFWFFVKRLSRNLLFYVGSLHSFGSICSNIQLLLRSISLLLRSSNAAFLLRRFLSASLSVLEIQPCCF